MSESTRTSSPASRHDADSSTQSNDHRLLSVTYYPTRIADPAPLLPLTPSQAMHLAAATPERRDDPVAVYPPPLPAAADRTQSPAVAEAGVGIGEEGQREVGPAVTGAAGEAVETVETVDDALARRPRDAEPPSPLTGWRRRLPRWLRRRYRGRHVRAD